MADLRQFINESSRDECNPSRGRPAYVSAALPCEHVKKPCELQVAPVYPDDPIEEDIILPPCVAVRCSNDPNATLQDYTYSEFNDRYEAPDGSTATYDPSLGWAFNTAGGIFSQTTATTDVPGLYCSGNDYISVTTCDKGAPVVEPPDCITMLCAEDTNLTSDSFNGVNGIYSPNNGGSGTVTYNGTNWVYSVNGVVYTGPTTEGDPQGLYIDPNGRVVTFTDNCPDVVPPCVYPAQAELIFAENIVAVPEIGVFALQPDNSYNENDPLANIGLLFYDGANWTFTSGGVTYTGGDDECDPLGVFTDEVTGEIVVFRAP